MDYLNEIRIVVSDLEAENYGQAKLRLEVVVESALREEVVPDALLSAIFELLKRLIREDKPGVMKSVIEMAEGLGDYYIELLKPFSMVMDYLRTKDVTHILRMQITYREVFLPLLGLRSVPNPNGKKGCYVLIKEADSGTESSR